MSITNLDQILDDDLFVVTDGDNGHKSVSGAALKDLLAGLDDFEINAFSAPFELNNVIYADTAYTYTGNASSEEPTPIYTFYVGGSQVQSSALSTLDVVPSYAGQPCYVRLTLTESATGHPGSPRSAVKDSGTITIPTPPLEDFEITRFNDPFEDNNVVYAGSYQYTGNASINEPTPTYRWFVNGARVKTGPEDTLDIIPSYQGGICYVSLELTESSAGHPESPRSDSKNSNAITLSSPVPDLVITSSGSVSHSSPLNPGKSISISGFAAEGGQAPLSYSYSWTNNSGTQVGTSSSYTVSSSDVGKSFRRRTTVTSADGQTVSDTSNYSSTVEAEVIPPSVNSYGSWTKSRYNTNETAQFVTTTFNNAPSVSRSNTIKRYRNINQMCCRNANANWGTPASNLSGSQLRKIVTNTSTSKTNTLWTLTPGESRRMEFYFGSTNTGASRYTRQSSQSAGIYYEQKPWAIIFYFTLWQEGSNPKDFDFQCHDRTNAVRTKFEMRVSTTGQADGKRCVLIHRTNNKDSYQIQFEHRTGARVTLNAVGVCSYADWAHGDGTYNNFPGHNLAQLNNNFNTSISDSDEGVYITTGSVTWNQVIPEGYFYVGMSESISVPGLGTVKNPSSGQLNTGIQAGSNRDAVAEQIERTRLGSSNASADVVTVDVDSEGIDETNEQDQIIPGEIFVPNPEGENYGDPIPTS